MPMLPLLPLPLPLPAFLLAEEGPCTNHRYKLRHSICQASAKDVGGDAAVAEAGARAEARIEIRVEARIEARAEARIEARAKSYRRQIVVQHFIFLRINTGFGAKLSTTIPTDVNDILDRP
ncbi:hypothetical protein AOQ84DRAFT_368371 [Glonium stellatum]|uniref:Uncharacterized protein n=1 Tax=Glonium stellatum TaxID=574774 RepID=A0A8E2JN26_9PEZI|nr:hypothetical protein AOQ84DRAFT_368371 [Glonium stellatum]